MPTTATSIEAELVPKVTRVDLPTNRVQIKLALDVLVDGRLWQKFGFQTAPYRDLANAKDDARGAIKANPMWMRPDVVAAELERQIEEL